MEFFNVKLHSSHRDNEIIELSDIELLNIMHSDGTLKLQAPTQMLYYVQPKLLLEGKSLDLNVGFKQHKIRNSFLADSKHNTIEHFLSTHPNVEGFLKDLNICTQRSALKTIMLLPYTRTYNSEYKGNWIATKFNGQIYLSLKQNEDWSNSPSNFYNFKLRQCCFADAPHKQPNTVNTIDLNQQFFGTYTAKLANIKLLYSAEISGLNNEKEIDDFTNPEQLKNCQVVLPKLILDKPDWHKHTKIFNYLPQAYLIGAKHLTIGLLDEKMRGNIRKPLQQVATDELGQHQKFKMNYCATFLYKFLHELQILMKNVDCPYTSFIFEYNAAKKIFTYKIIKGKSEYSYLSDKFVQLMQERKKNSSEN